MTSDPSSDSPDTAALSPRSSSIGSGATESITLSRLAHRCRLGPRPPLFLAAANRPSLRPPPDAWASSRCSLPGNRVADETIPPAEFSFYQMLGGFANRPQFGAQPVDHDIDRPVGRWPVFSIQRFGERLTRL